MRIAGRAVAVALVLGVLAGLAWFLFWQPPGASERPAPATKAGRPADASTRELKPLFRCDGRTQCEQMTSCEEAMFFLQNCPRTELDQDQDGIPCEVQWCQK